MKILLSAFLICWWGMAFCQFSDDFSDGEFSTGTVWKGDTALFRVNAAGQLQLNATSGSLAQLHTASNIARDAEWKFFVKLGFSPSGNNYNRIYLISNNSDLSGALDGYFLQLGEAGSEDGVDLFRQDGFNTVKLIDGPAKQVARSSNTLRIRVTNNAGKWQILTDTLGGSNYSFAGECTDSTYKQGGYFGLLAKYTPSNGGKFYWDDISVTPHIVVFRPQKGDVAISEILPDPTPQVGLPASEYIELYNTTAYPIPLSKWQLADESRVAELPDDTLQPHGFAILASDADSFVGFGKTIKISLPSLNNDGDILTLTDSLGNIIDKVQYSTDWYPEEKKQGGWSLELIDPSSECRSKGNWQASKDSFGGTPGNKNSVLGLELAPEVSSVEISGPNSLIVHFTYPVDSASLADVNNYFISEGIGNPIRAEVTGTESDRVKLIYTQTFPRSSTFKLTMKNLTSCIGTEMKKLDLSFTIPDTPEPFDLVVNEILFNPEPDGADFVEVFNRSDKIFDLKDISIATLDDEGDLKNIYALSDSDKFLHPGEFVVLTTDLKVSAERYWVKYPEKVLVLRSLPAFPDKEGAVILLRTDSLRLDEVLYHESWHFPLLVTNEGVSLEKINPSMPSNDQNSWHSAAGSAGYATPTYQNSQYKTRNERTKDVKLLSDIFSPDNDGYQDVLSVTYAFEKPMVARVSIFDIQGRPVRIIYNNELLSLSGVVHWDGITAQGSRAPIGAYIILFEVHSNDGEARAYKLTCTLAEKM